MISIGKINGKFLLAISGGVDSIVLLDMFSKIYNEKNLIVAHYNHNIRGKESDGDELFVKDLSKKYGIKSYSEKAKISPKNEEEARDLRYNFLFKIANKEKCNFIVTAQHRDDQIETLMLQIIRGTGGLSVMKKFSVIPHLMRNLEKNKDRSKSLFLQEGENGLEIFRPFLQFTKQDLINYAKANKLKWREDSTNRQSIYTRNKFRNEIIPKILEINPNFGESILNFAEISLNNYEFIKKTVKGILNGNDCITKIVFDELHISLKREIVKQLNSSGKTLTFKNIKEIIEMIEKGIGGKQKHGFTLEKGIVYFNKNFKLDNFQLILASSSPQRRRLMSNIANDFIIIPSRYEEKWDDKKSIKGNAEMFAEKKAMDVAKRYPGNLTIGCDTFVIHPKYGVYMKPKDINEARNQLISYSGEKIKVISGISVVKYSKTFFKNVSTVETIIEFDKIPSAEINIWLSKNEWQGRSGSCSIEGYASKFIKKIEGCFFNIVGLPVYELDKMLKKFNKK